MTIHTSASERPQSDEVAPPELMADRANEPRLDASLLDTLIALARRKRFILGVTAAFASVSAVISLVLPTTYTANVVLLPPQQNASVAGSLSAQLGGLGSMATLAGSSLGIKNPNDMFVAMLRSRTVEDAMVQRFGLMQEYHQKYPSDARRVFEHKAVVSGDGKDGLIHITVEDKDPKRAAELANGYVDQFRNLSEHLALTEASRRRFFFEQQLQQAKDNLVAAEQALKSTEQRTGLIQLDSQARALIESAASLRAQITAKEVQIRSLQTFATSQNAQLVQAEQELESLREQLAQLGGSGESGGQGLILPKGKVPQAGLEYVREYRDVKYRETIFEILARQFEAAKLDEARQGAMIQVVDSATPPDKRSSPKRRLIVMGATMVGFVVGVFWVLMQLSFKGIQADAELHSKMELLKRTVWSRK